MRVALADLDGLLGQLKTFLAPPSTDIQRYLAPGERKVLIDGPAFNAFFVDELPIILLTVVVGGAAVVWGTTTGNLFVAGLAMVGSGSLMLYLRAKRWVERYTAYVLTTSRVMRVSGFFKRNAAWIPWAKVTDVRYEQSLMGRLCGYATVFIDSANETSGLASMKNLQDPRAFYLTLTRLVQSQQGSLDPAPELLT
jgi:hypothetical protein